MLSAMDRLPAAADGIPKIHREAYPHLVLQAFLQRVINGGGQIVREMALAYYEKSHEKAHVQLCRYMDRLGVSEGWLVVFDPDLTKDWDGKLASEDVSLDEKSVHLVRC